MTCKVILLAHLHHMTAAGSDVMTGIMGQGLAGVLGWMAGLILWTGPVAAQTVAEVAREIEAQTGGRVGLAVLDAGKGTGPAWRAGERFALMSTFKPLACAAYLDQSRRAGGREISMVLDADAVVAYSPLMAPRAGEVVSGREACAAALRLSDNTAANILLELIGGPSALTAYLRESGDAETRLDRYETALNSVLPGDVRDTTTPSALLASYTRHLLGEALSMEDQDQLIAWMASNQVSPRLLRDQAPATWQIADRSGAGGEGSRSYVALIRIEGRAPVILTAFLTQTELDLTARDAVLARLISAALADIGLHTQAAPTEPVMLELLPIPQP